MLVALSFAMFACFIYLLISGRMSAVATLIPVSYTHLTLPTILLV